MAVEAKKTLLILGGGLIGLSIAHELAQEGRKVEVLSRRRSEAAGFVAAGMLAPHAEGLNKKLLELGQLSLKRIPTWVKKIEANSGMDCGLRQCGIVVPFLSATERDTYPTASFGEKLNRIQLEKEIPGIAPHWNSGLLFKEDGQIDNRRQLMRALEKACVELGVHFQEGVEVIKLLKNNQEFQGVQIKNAEGIIQDLISQEAILCSGAWSKKILQELPIFPIKGQMLSIQGPKDALKRIIFGPGTYLVPREDGLIVVGATSEKNAGFTEGLTPFGQKELQQGINNLLPSASQWPHMERWWGFRPCTPDEMPIIGKSSLKGLWLATGHYRNGVLFASTTAELLTKCIQRSSFNETEHQLLLSFNLNRFKSTGSISKNY